MDEFADQLYYLPDQNAYVIARVEEKTAVIEQIFSEHALNISKLAMSLAEDITCIKLGFTPTDKADYKIHVHKEEDSTLFILGDDLAKVEQGQFMFPVLSHA